MWRSVVPLMIRFASENPAGTVIAATGQRAWVLHWRSSDGVPAHSSPPCAGAGLPHARVRVCRPPPQLLVHVLTPPHADQPPATGHGSGSVLVYMMYTCMYTVKANMR